MSKPVITLHTYYRSSSSSRLRIALNLKGLPYHPVYVNLATNEQKTPAYKALNPSGTVPLLVHHITDGRDVSIGQSTAALEYLEEAFPEHVPLLPPATDAAGRAFVRELVSVVVADIQPVSSMRVLAALDAKGVPTAEWAKEWTQRGMAACEALLARRAGGGGKFAYGDGLSLADVVLVPAVWNAKTAGVDMAAYPRVSDVFAAVESMDEVKRAFWRNQEDCPADQR